MDQGELTGIFSSRPQNFAWFLGAGTSRSAGLPTATDILRDMKLRYYCREENQDISRQDIQNDAIRERIQAYMESHGFPAEWAEDEYSTYFKKIFGDDKERQRRYLKAILSEDRASLTVGHRVLAALIASELARVVFTTNFDNIIEKAVAEVAGRSIAAYHLEGSHNANHALNNEEYPIYCKLHGDFRYDSVKNLPDDLATQNADLSSCLMNAGQRFGFIVSGYSGRDESVMGLLRGVLESQNPFPHGLFWTGIKGSTVLPVVEELLEQARAAGVNAQYVPIETFDALMLRLWRNVDDKVAELDAKVRKSRIAFASIPLPSTGGKNPILRLNALPVLSLPRQCFALSLKEQMEWSDVRKARNESEGGLILTKTDSVCCWGSQELIKDVFQGKLTAIEPRTLPDDLGASENLNIKGFFEEAICKALARGKPILSRTSRYSSFLIADPHAEATGDLAPLHDVVGKPFGHISGLFAPVTEEYPHPERVSWAEAVRVSLEMKNQALWLQLDPDIWVWPPRAREVATVFLDDRRGDRFNKKYNALLDAWARIALGTDERNAAVSISAFGEGNDAENPIFRVGTRTAFARRLAW